MRCRVVIETYETAAVTTSKSPALSTKAAEVSTAATGGSEAHSEASESTVRPLSIPPDSG